MDCIVVRAGQCIYLSWIVLVSKSLRHVLKEMSVLGIIYMRLQLLLTMTGLHGCADWPVYTIVCE